MKWQKIATASAFTQFIDFAVKRADAINYGAVRNDFTVLFTRLIKMLFSFARRKTPEKKKISSVESEEQHVQIFYPNAFIEIHFCAQLLFSMNYC